MRRRSPATSPTQYLAALRNRCFSSKAVLLELLGQPGGFHGLLFLHEQAPLADLSLMDGEDEAEVHIDLDPALLPASTAPLGDEHLAPRRGINPEELDSILVPLLRPDSQGFQDATVPALLRRDAGQIGRLGDDDVLVAESQDALDVALLECGKGISDDLDVLLRHRPRSISRRAENHIRALAPDYG